jgi:hypothetical protein
MNPYVEAGYVVVLATLAVYAAALVVRERSARRRAAVGLPQPVGDNWPHSGDRDARAGARTGGCDEEHAAAHPELGADRPAGRRGPSRHD